MTVTAGVATTTVAACAVAGHSPDAAGAYIATITKASRSCDTSSSIARAYAATISGAASRKACATDPAAPASAKMTTASAKMTTAATKMTTAATTSASTSALCKAGHTSEQQYAQGDQHLLFHS